MHLRNVWTEVQEQVSELRKVERAAAKAAVARSALQTAVREAHENGQPLRKIAEAAGVSHEQVRRLISQDQASGS